MPPSAPTRSWTGVLLAAVYAATVNLAVPVVLASLLAGVLYRHIHPNIRDQAPDGSGYGPITLHLRLSGTNAGIPEPIIICGVPGKASLVYIRVLRKDRAQMGIEFWGLKAIEGEDFAIPANNEIDLTCSLPAYFPKEGSRRWGGAPASLQRQRRTEYEITVDGVVRLKGPINYEQPEHSRLYFGVNAVGGSWVSSRFTGMVLKVSQSF